MTLNQLRAFLESARRGSFTAAAGVLQVSQASVSELIRRLEDEHAVQLFVRGGRRLVLTTAGQELLVHAEHAVAAVENAGRALHSMRTIDGGVATFGVLRNAEYYLLSGLAQRFVELYPAVRVRLIGQNSVDVAAAVSEGTLEAGLVVLPIDAEGLRVEPWARDEVVYVSADPDRAAAPVDVHSLASARLVLYDAHAGWRDPTATRRPRAPRRRPSRAMDRGRARRDGAQPGRARRRRHHRVARGHRRGAVPARSARRRLQSPALRRDRFRASKRRTAIPGDPRARPGRTTDDTRTSPPHASRGPT